MVVVLATLGGLLLNAPLGTLGQIRLIACLPRRGRYDGPQEIFLTAEDTNADCVLEVLGIWKQLLFRCAVRVIAL